MERAANELNLDRLVHSSRERLVAVEVDGNGLATLFSRFDADEVLIEPLAFEPWLLVAGDELAGLLPALRVEPLRGEGVYNRRVHFDSAKQCEVAGRSLREASGCNASDVNAPYRLFNDYQQQLLSTLPARLFRGMEFGELVRLQLDIETLTTTGYDFPNPERPDDQIIMIAMRDSTGWEECLVNGEGMDEAAMLAAMVEIVRRRDPDVIEGHNIFNFDLPFIETRCRRHGVALGLGRDGRPVEARSSRFTAGEHTSTYRRYAVWGRHVIDTLQLVQLYDVSHRDLDSYGLKNVARHFGVAAPDRTYVEGRCIGDLWRADPARLRAYAMDDVRETEAISRILSPSYFYQAQIVPFSYQNCVSRGNAARIDALLIAQYMNLGAALPKPQLARPFSGGLTESFASGVFANVWHIDVQSLYPSIMVSRGIHPAGDSCNVYNSLLAELRLFRLAAKRRKQAAHEAAERDHFEALQSSFKILINSFYGYLGFGQGTFNDFDQAEAVTTEGRRILTLMVEFLARAKARVIEIDTDGIYFIPPAGVDDTEVFTAQVQAILPAGIEVELDATYASMFSYKSKNYALLGHDGSVAITGAALKSRGLERFQRDYIQKVVTLLLKGQGEQVQGLYERYRRLIEGHELPVDELAKRETLSTPPKVYQEKLAAGQTRRSAAYELVLQAQREYRQGDQVAFYVTGVKKNVSVAEAAKLLADADPAQRDENVAYYLDKLDKLHEKFVEFVPRPADASDLPLFSANGGR